MLFFFGVCKYQTPKGLDDLGEKTCWDTWQTAIGSAALLQQSLFPFMNAYVAQAIAAFTASALFLILIWKHQLLTWQSVTHGTLKCFQLHSHNKL